VLQARVIELSGYPLRAAPFFEAVRILAASGRNPAVTNAARRANIFP